MAPRAAKWMSLAAVLLTVPAAHAGSLEKLLMPGPVSRAHARFENDCGECHDRSDRSRRPALCLACHDHASVAADIANGTGLHGRIARKARCEACHAEHQGRDADIVHFDPAGFDHRQTDFTLTGVHATVACAACHKAGKRYREAPVQCQACHRRDDVHRGKLGGDCARCHDAAGFQRASFDHAKTRFPLRDAHLRVPCSACHRDAGYAGAPTQCADCHAADDVHRGSRGSDCASCHQLTSWKGPRFDHARETGYALQGRHAALACAACHRGGDLKAPLPKDCGGCHAAADRHAGRFGTGCADCHGQQEWAVASFDHDKAGQFPLRGAHRKLSCNSCHTGVLKQQQLPKDCRGCHAVDDVHRGAMGSDCAQCHAESGWRDQVSFDHDLAKFPLVGLHVDVPCEECHVSRAYRDAPLDCVSCHRVKDVHRGRLGERCGSCHNANGWAYWQFDHDRQTHFALTGAHARLGCRDCHQDPRRDARPGRDCRSCHARDDVHDDRFGRDCGRCHGTDSFRGAAGSHQGESP